MCELYDELAIFFQKEQESGVLFGIYVNQLRKNLEQHADQFKKNFEHAYTEFVLKNTTEYALPDPALSLLEGQKPLALYFSRFVLDRTRMDYYSKLLDALDRTGNIPHTIFGSLNYDCLFEQAARILDLSIDYECGNGVDDIRVDKIHGSSNFIAEIDQRIMAMLASTNVHVEVQVSFLSVENLEKELSEKLLSGRTVNLPVMSQVSHYKEQALATGKIQRMRNGWNAGVHDAKKIAIIGVSFNSYDQHIIEQIKNASGTVLYIGDKESFKKWQAVNRSARCLGRRLEDGFDALLKHLGI
jgi:flavin-binding protein dodecin